jgi:D-glycero-D-manno-heptose 1,7-bisphosphate phosphatase
MSHAVFFDRDGVLNSAVLRDGRSFAPLSLDEFHIESEAPEAVERIRSAGLETIVVTNQPELSVGTLDPSLLEAMHEQVRTSLGIHHFYVCPHTSNSGCACHKPAPGLIMDACRALGVDASGSYMIGDRWRDVGAGRAAGCLTILIKRDYSYLGVPAGFSEEPDISVESLSDAVSTILEYEKTREFR